VIGPINDPIVSSPWDRQAALIAAAADNAAGGIMGHQVQIDFCDDHYSGPQAGICAQKLLVQDKVLMLAGLDGTQDAAIDPVLASTNTISFGDFGASVASIGNDRTYILGPLEGGSWVMPQMLPSTVKHVTYVTADSAIAIQAEQALKVFLPKTIQLSTVLIPLTATSMQASCLQVKNSGGDTVMVEANPVQAPQIIQTCQQLGVNNVLWLTTSVQVQPALAQTVTNLHVPNLVVLSFSGSAVQQFAADAAKYGPQVGGITNTTTDDSVNAWLGVKLLPSLISQAGSLDPTVIKNYLDHQTAFSTNGATPPVNFTTTQVSQIPRLKNLCAYQGEIQNGKLVQTNPNAYCFHG
jgi:ABC-type branched-subunit amino acid transport system substrate-binding protein